MTNHSHGSLSYCIYYLFYTFYNLRWVCGWCNAQIFSFVVMKEWNEVCLFFALSIHTLIHVTEQHQLVKALQFGYSIYYAAVHFIFVTGRSTASLCGRFISWFSTQAFICTGACEHVTPSYSISAIAHAALLLPTWRNSTICRLLH